MGDPRGREVAEPAGSEVRPIPDPTRLTTLQLMREIQALREVLETRLDGMDKAIELLQATADRFPARMDEKIAAAVGIHDEKFTSIAKQFEERDVRAEAGKRDGKDALDAALSAQKEAAEKQATTFGLSVAKSEAATDKRIDQQAALISTTAAGLEGKITDVKDRLTRIEGKGEGQVGQTQSSTASTHLIIAGLALLVSVTMAILVIVKML